ncbi:cyclic nucleotide-binding domain-containing protein [candidate division CSSED10-310 bacterium]|uniref:Cyclic nucleotide-binding domain-containing protein n=1 Tax=candidate division CSSED10-310 bacterium TaxID=2855610 RepID=A0ABV6YU81_UNCC1
MSDSKIALYLAAEKYRLGKNYKKAIEKYRESLRIEPGDLAIIKKLSGLLEKENRDEEAAESYLYMARVLVEKENLEDAIATVQRALALKPDNPTGVTLLQELQEEATIPIDVVDEEDDDQDQIKDLETPPVQLDTPLFKDLNEEQLETIINVITTQKVSQDTIIFQEGDTSDSLYIVSEGSVEVRTKVAREDDAKKDTVFSVLESGQFFGEFAFLTGKPRVATVTAREDSVIYTLTKTDLDDIIKKYPEVESRLFLFYKSRALDLVLAKSELFHSFAVEERRELLERFILKKYAAGDLIIREGQEDDNLFLIKKGTLRVETTKAKGQKIVLGTLEQHQFFGEISFLTRVPRTADVVADTDAELLYIGREDLEQIITKHPHVKNTLEQFQQSRAMETLKKMMT